MTEPSAIILEVQTPLGFRVRTTAAYWLLIQTKHPEVTSRFDALQDCLVEPTEVRRSKVDPDVYLFYRPLPPYHLCVVVKRLDGEGFVITSYVTDAIKEGERLWPASA